VELVHNKGCLGQYETAFDDEMEAIADIMEFVNQNEIPGDLTIHSDSQAAIARVSHTGTGPGHDRAIWVVKAVQNGRNEAGGRALNGFLAIQGFRGMNVPTNSLGNLGQRRKLGEPQSPGLKKEFPNITLCQGHRN
jgi:hypothetical protein